MRFFLALILSLGFAFSASSVNLTDASSFEAYCLKSGQGCLYVAMAVKPNHKLATRNIRYLPSTRRSDLADLFRFISRHGGKLFVVPSAEASGSSVHWTRLTDTASLVRLTTGMSPKDTVVAKLDWLELDAAPADSTIDFQQDFRDKPNQLQIILVEGTAQMPLYIESVNRNIHHYYSTLLSPYGTVTIHISGWKKKYDGSFFIITPISSWKVFAKLYLSHSEKMEDSAKLPIFHGDNQQKVSKVVSWMASHFVWSGAFGGGAFPDQLMSKTLERKAGDCKALDLVFRAALRRSGIDAHATLISSHLMPPLSYTLPDLQWADHVVTYIPSVKKYVDITTAIEHPSDWQDNGKKLTGATTLDVSTGRFAIIYVTRRL